MRIKYRISEAVQKSFCVAQNEANRRLHFVSVVKKMRQAWDDGKAERVGLDKYPHHPRQHSQRPRSPHPFSPEMQSAFSVPLNRSHDPET